MTEDAVTTLTRCKVITTFKFVFMRTVIRKKAGSTNIRSPVDSIRRLKTVEWNPVGKKKFDYIILVESWIKPADEQSVEGTFHCDFPRCGRLRTEIEHIYSDIFALKSTAIFELDCGLQGTELPEPGRHRHRG